MDLFQQAEKLRESIRFHEEKARSLRIEARDTVQGIYAFYYVKMGRKDFPEHIRETVQYLDKKAYG